jgi:hypothetical protein|tara:strand:+ start:1009 stop:1491 length:483 start_codon:yes stop_codon:yes gene_type:complete
MMDDELYVNRINMIYAYFQAIDEILKGKSLGKFSTNDSGDSNAWHGSHFHTFYELNYNKESELYVKGDLERSVFVEKGDINNLVVLSAKLISVDSKKDAVDAYLRCKTSEYFSTLSVDEIVGSCFVSQGWLVGWLMIIILHSLMMEFMNLLIDWLMKFFL